MKFSQHTSAITILALVLSSSFHADFHTLKPDWSSLHPLHYFAAIGNNTEIKTCIFHHTYAINEKDEIGWTPLFYAFRWDNMDAAQMLLENGAQINICDNDGDPLLNMVVRYGSTNGFSCLLHAGVDTTQTNKNKWTPLHQLSLADNTDIIAKANLLNAYNIDLNQRDTFGATALHYAAMGNPTLFNWLLINGGQVYLTDNNGWNILHYAAASGSLDRDFLSDVLLNNINLKILINQQDMYGNTPFHIAALSKDILCSTYFNGRPLYIIRTDPWSSGIWLLQHAADKTICNNDGLTVTDLAKQEGNNIITFLPTSLSILK